MTDPAAAEAQVEELLRAASGGPHRPFSEGNYAQGKLERTGPDALATALDLARALRGYTVNHPFQHKALARWDRLTQELSDD